MTLQIACAYGDLTARLTASVGDANGTLDIVDVLPIQLLNLRRKLASRTTHAGPARTRLLTMDSAQLELPDRSYDQVLVFFLLHEQPAEVRRRTLREAVRVVKTAGKIVVVDYAQPRYWHPLRYLWRVVLLAFEPFALDLWSDEIDTWMPATGLRKVHTESFFGGLYRATIFIREERC